jgi:hypothetical protein
MHDETIFTSCPHCTRAFNLSNPEVRLDPPAVFCVHCGKKFIPDAEDLERAIKYRSGQASSSRKPS